MDIENEIKDLRRRVGDLEGAVCALTGHLQDVHPEVVRLRSQAAAHFETTERVMAGIVSRLDTVNAQVWSLRDDLPEMIGQALKPAGPDDLA